MRPINYKRINNLKSENILHGIQILRLSLLLFMLILGNLW